MSGFNRLQSVAAPLPESDIDTDVIFPARFLLLIHRSGLAQYLFHERRHQPASRPFVLDISPFDKAEILVTGPNFGCGSSREQAVWALADFGIRCIIAPSFGEIFHANCFRNALLPVVLEPAAHARVMAAASKGMMATVDLDIQQIELPGEQPIAFAVDAYRRRALLLGLDEIGGILADDASDISAFEAKQRSATPWLQLNREQLAPLVGHGSDCE